jgi:uncharacterized membrane protein YkoI
MSANGQVASAILEKRHDGPEVMLRSFRSALFAMMATVALAATAGAQAHARDHDDARHAVERGEIRPLSEILAALRGKLPGDVVRVEIEQKNGRWLYEFRTLDAQGRLFDVYVDARSGEIERVREK